MAPTDRDALIEHLSALLSRGGDGNRLLIEAGPSYLLVTGGPGRPALVCEAVADDLLGEHATPARRGALERLGYRKERDRRNPSRVVPVADPSALAALADEALALLALGPPAPLRLELTLGQAEPTRNPELIRAMKLLATTREMSARQRVYHHLLAADLLLALDPDGDDDDPAPHIFERLQGYPVIGAFTDWDALRLWQPRGWPYRVLPGRSLFPLAHAGRYGSVLINRGGNVGGELLMNEIEALARVARARSA